MPAEDESLKHQILNSISGKDRDVMTAQPAASASSFLPWFTFPSNEKPTYLIKEKAADGCWLADSQRSIWLIFHCIQMSRGGKHLDVFLMRLDHWLSRLLSVVLQVYWSNPCSFTLPFKFSICNSRVDKYWNWRVTGTTLSQHSRRLRYMSLSHILV